jgi:hypothetical protein
MFYPLRAQGHKLMLEKRLSRDVDEGLGD